MFNPVLCRYGTIGAYGQSKLANILHANELARRFKVCSVSSKCFLPMCAHSLDFVIRTLHHVLVCIISSLLGSTCYMSVLVPT
jgi:hypothetical protein